MSTSSKVKFNLETLRAKALESIDFRIAAADLNVKSFDDDEALTERIRTWRVRQEERISHLFASLGEGGVADYTLNKWKIEPMPSVDAYDRRRAEAELQRLQSLRSKITAKAGSLVADEDGNISLTKTQLAEFFGL